MSNIFEPITGSALSQIKVRQTKISQEFRDNETIAWLNSNGAFVRLKSSVDTIDDNLKQFSNDQPYTLASRYTLEGGIQSGLTNEGMKRGSQHSGIPPSSNAAYGFENSILGPKPMPGIEKVSIKTVGEGYLREATINLRANTPEQLNILDTLYFKLGYSALLEWGHTAYFTNDEEFKNNSYKEINLSKGKTKSDILEEIEKNREESSYNYDAMFAVVENFQWNLRDDGGYDVTLKLISTGDIVDSLKINSTPLISDLNQKGKSSEEGSTAFEKNLLKSKLHSLLIPILYYSGNLELGGNFFTRLLGWATNNPFLVSRGTSLKTFFFQKEDIIPESTSTLIKPKNTIGYRLKFPNLNFPFSPHIKNNPEYSEVMVYGGVDEDIKIGERTQNEFFKKDYIPTEYGSYIKLGLLFDIINNLFIYGDDNENLVELETDLDSSKCFIHPYSSSPDPSICLYYNSRLIIPTGGENVLRKLTDTNFIDDKYTGNLLRIHVNIQYILNTFEQNLDENGDISLKSFLKNLLQGINLCLGGLNKFNIITQTDLDGKEKINIISLYNNPINYTLPSFYDPEDPNNKILEIFGNETLFHNISLSSELTNDVSSLVSISAQAGNYETNSEGGDAFSYLNKGIEDRIIPKKTIKEENLLEKALTESAQELSNPIYNTSQTFTSEQEEAIKNNQTDIVQTTSKTSRKGNLALYIEYLQTLYTSIPRDNLSKTTLTSASAKSTLKDLIKDELSTNTQTAGKSIIIPINLSFTMQGFSGWKLFNEFVIPTNFLPNNYQYPEGEPKFKFVVSGIDHEITSNLWKTSISTYMAPLLIKKYITKQEPYVGPIEDYSLIINEALEENRATVFAPDATRTNNIPQQDIDSISEQINNNEANQDNLTGEDLEGFFGFNPNINE